MRTSNFAALALLMLAACAPAVDQRISGSDSSEPDDGNGVSQTSGDVTTPAPAAVTPTPPPTPGVAGVDCDPTFAGAAATTLLDDPLVTDTGNFTTATGFTANWSYSASSLNETRLEDAGDLTLFNKDAQVGDVAFSINSASTEVSGAFSPRLRQMFVVVGATVNAGVVSALGCGIEVGASATTSVVRLSGSPSAVISTTLSSAPRGSVQINESFTMKARLQAGTLTCAVTEASGTTTATATGLGTVLGSVGLFTRQTKGLFRTAKICKFK